MSFSLGTSPYGAPWWVGSIVNETHETYPWSSIIQPKQKQKNLKQPYIESDNSEEKMLHEPPFPKFIILESLESNPLTKLSPFLIKKIISSSICPKSVKNLRNGTIMVETENKKHTNFLLNMNTFHTLKIKTYPHKTLNWSKRIIRNKELSQCSREEILAELKNQGVINDIKKITIKKENQTILTNTYILTFNSPTTQKEIKISYINEKIETYIPNPLRCYKCVVSIFLFFHSVMAVFLPSYQITDLHTRHKQTPFCRKLMLVSLSCPHSPPVSRSHMWHGGRGRLLRALLRRGIVWTSSSELSEVPLKLSASALGSRSDHQARGAKVGSTVHRWMIHHCRYSPTDSCLGRAGCPSHGVECHQPAQPAHWRCRWFVPFENWWCTSYWELSPRRCPLTHTALLFLADQADARQCPWCALGTDRLHWWVCSQQSQHPLVLYFIYRPLLR